MEQEKVVEARDYVSKTASVKEQDGFWKVVVTISDRVKYEGEDWIEETVEAMSIDNIFSQAIQTAMASALGVIVDQVYNRGFAGLVESREYDRRVASGEIGKLEEASEKVAKEYASEVKGN